MSVYLKSILTVLVAVVLSFTSASTVFASNQNNQNTDERVKISHMYTGKDGLTHFEDYYIYLDKNISILKFSKLFSATGFLCAEAKTNPEAVKALASPHNPKVPTLVIVLEGKVRITTSSGDSRIFSPGSPYDSIFLIDSITGEGHSSEVLANPLIQIGIVLSKKSFGVTWKTK